MNASSSVAAQGGEGSDARGRGRRSGRVPPSPSAGTSWTQSAARNAINIDDNGNAGHAEDDDTDNNDDESDDDTDNESSARPSVLSCFLISVDLGHSDYVLLSAHPYAYFVFRIN